MEEKKDSSAAAKEATENVNVVDKAERNKRIRREVFNVLLTLVAAFLHAFGLWFFVYPAKFAPSEISGIATMIYTLTGLNAGYFTLIFNIPLLVVAWFFLKRKYVIYTVLFTVLTSVMLIVVEAVGFPQYVEGDNLLAAIFSGVIFGVRTGVMLRMGASTGGSDIIGGLVQRRYPYMNVERVIAFVGYAIALISYFVYRDLSCILLSIVQMFVVERVAAVVLKDRRNAIEVKIVTSDPYALRDEIITNLRHSATVLECTGMYSEQGKYMVVSVLNTHQIPELSKMIKRYPNTFMYYSDVAGVTGNFRWRKEDQVK